MHVAATTRRLADCVSETLDTCLDSDSRMRLGEKQKAPTEVLQQVLRHAETCPAMSIPIRSYDDLRGYG